MRALGAVFAREIGERWPVAAAGLVVGLAPLLLPLLPSVARHGARSVREAAAVGLLAAATLLFAAILGGSVLHRDLSERRLGFYFARPIAGWQIWAGKVGAAVTLAAAASLLVAVPAVVEGGLVGLFGERAFVAAWLWLLIVAVPAAHAVRLALTARTPWLVVDLAALALVGGTLAWTARCLSEAWATEAAISVTLALAAALVVALLAATLLQVTRGRVSLARGHRLLSIAFWSVALAAAVGAAVWTRWVIASAPEDLHSIRRVEAAPVGSWCWLTGEARAGYRPSYLFDLESGRWLAVGVDNFDTAGWERRAFSPEGGAAIRYDLGSLAELALGDGRSPNGSYLVGDLTASPPASRSLPASAYPGEIALSMGGRLLAIASVGTVEVRSLEPPGRPKRQRLPEGAWPRQLVAAADGWLLAGVVCGPQRGESCARVLWWLDLEADRPPVEVAREPAVEVGGAVPGWMTVEVDGGVALAQTRAVTAAEPSRVYRVDLGSLEAEAIELPPSPEAPWRASLLRDGRVLLARSTPREQLRLLVPGEGGDRSLSLPAEGAVEVGGEPAPGRVLVGARSPGGRTTAWMVDVDVGEVREIGDGLLPAGHRRLGPESAGSRLLRRGDVELLLVDPQSLALRRVLRGP